MNVYRLNVYQQEKTLARPTPSWVWEVRLTEPERFFLGTGTEETQDKAIDSAMSIITCRDAEADSSEPSTLLYLRKLFPALRAGGA